MRKIIVIMLLGFFLTAQGTTVYESKDAEGNPSFSDIATPNAEQIELSTGAEESPASTTTPDNSSTPPTTSSPVTPGIMQPASVPEEDKEDAYSLLQLVDMNTDADKAISLNAAATGYIQQPLGNINIGIFLAPDLQQGDTIEIVLDGDVKFAATQLSTFTLETFDPGPHTLLARIVSNNGEVLKNSNQMTLFMHRAAGGQGGS